MEIIFFLWSQFYTKKRVISDKFWYFENFWVKTLGQRTVWECGRHSSEPGFLLWDIDMVHTSRGAVKELFIDLRKIAASS